MGHDFAGRDLYAAEPDANFTNSWRGRDPMGCSTYCYATSLAVLEAAQKYGGDSIQPIWREVGTTRMGGTPSG